MGVSDGTIIIIRFRTQRLQIGHILQQLRLYANVAYDYIVDLQHGVGNIESNSHKIKSIVALHGRSKCGQNNRVPAVTDSSHSRGRQTTT